MPQSLANNSGQQWYEDSYALVTGTSNPGVRMTALFALNSLGLRSERPAAGRLPKWKMLISGVSQRRSQRHQCLRLRSRA